MEHVRQPGPPSGEQVESYDLTLHWQDKAGSDADGRIFRSRLTDGIALPPGTREAEGWKTKNIDRVKITGFELRWERKAKNWLRRGYYLHLAQPAGTGNRKPVTSKTPAWANTPGSRWHHLFPRPEWLARGCWRLVTGRTPSGGRPARLPPAGYSSSSTGPAVVTK